MPKRPRGVISWLALLGGTVLGAQMANAKFGHIDVNCFEMPTQNNFKNLAFGKLSSSIEIVHTFQITAA